MRGVHVRPSALGVLVLAAWICIYCESKETKFVTSPGDRAKADQHSVVEAALKEELKQEDAKKLESLLHWAIEHSDPQALAEGAAQAVVDEAVNAAILEKKRQRVKELSDIMDSQPSEAQLMKDALFQLTSLDSSVEEKVKALQALQILVEPIDNANDLKGMKGILPVVEALSHESPDMVAAAAYVLGTAASNNARFQLDLLEASPSVFTSLVVAAASSEEEVVVKAVYAMAALVRNHDRLRAAFTAAGGLQAVEAVMTSQPEPGAKGVVWGMYMVKAKRKALSLMMDLVHIDSRLAQRCVDKGLPKAMLALLKERDHDLQEKTLEGMRTLMEKTPAAIDAFKQTNGVEEVKQLHLLLYQTLEMAARSGAHDSEGNHYVQYLMGLCDQVVKMLQGRKPRTDHSEL